VTYTLGLAFAATGVLFPFFASFIGWLSPQNLAVGTSATGLQGKEGDLPRLVLKWSIALTLVMAFWVTLQAYVLPFLVP
jgi:L-lactate permease